MADKETEAVDPFIESQAAPATSTTQEADNVWRNYRRLPRNVVAIGLVSLLNDASSEIIYPLLPVFLSLTLGATPLVVGLIEGAAESLSSLLKLFAGYFSDRRGKRKVFVVVGYGIANVVRPLLAFAGSWTQVFAIRIVDRIGKGVRGAPRDAMIADAVSARQRGLAFGFHRAMDHLGAVVGPLIAYLLVRSFAGGVDTLTAADFTKIFLLASIPAIAAVVVVVFFVSESPQAKLVRELNAAAPAKLTLRGFDANFKRFLLIIALFTLSNSSDAFLLLRAQEAGVAITAIPLLWAVLHISKVVSSVYGGHLSDRMGRHRLIVAGWIVYAAVYAGFAFVTASVSVWVLFAIYGIYFGLVEGAEKALVADLVRPEQRGTAYGLYNLAFGITVLPASLLMGGLWSWFNAATAFLVSAAIGVLAAVLLMMFVKPRPEEGS